MIDDTTERQPQIVLEVDSRRRVALGKVGRPEHERYLATTDSDGTVHLVPAVVMSELEARLLANPGLVERIEADRADPSRLVKRTRTRPSAPDAG